MRYHRVSQIMRKCDVGEENLVNTLTTGQLTLMAVSFKICITTCYGLGAMQLHILKDEMRMPHPLSFLKVTVTAT